MRAVFALIFLLAALPAYAEETRLPKEFLGRWEPLSSGAGSAAVQINSNGLIYHTDTKTGKILRIYPYRMLFTYEGKTYIFIHTFTDQADTRLRAMRVKTEDQSQRLEIDMVDCDFTTDDFVRFPPTKLQSLVKKKVCPNGESLVTGGMIFGRDEKR